MGPVQIGHELLTTYRGRGGGGVAVTAVSWLMAAIAACVMVLNLGRRALNGLQEFLSALIQVIVAVGQVRQAWLELRGGAVSVDEGEEERRALP